MPRRIINTIAIIGIRGYPADFSGSSGIDFYNQSIVSRLISKGNSFILFTRSWVKNTENKHSKNTFIIKVPTINSKHLDTTIYSLLASIIVCFTSARIVWYHAPGSAIFSFLPKLVGKNIFLTIHGKDWKREKWGIIAKIILKIAEAISIKTSDKIFVVSKDLKKYIYQKYAKQSDLMTIEIPLNKKATSSKMIFNLYGLRKKKYILYLGRFVSEKRIDWIIKAFLSSKRINNKYLLVLAGGRKNNIYSNSLRINSKRNKKIIWTGFVKGIVKKELLANCKLFILPSSIEGRSIALAEAISFGRNCLVSDIQANLELKITSNKILTFKNNSYKDFYRKLNNII